MKVEVTKMLYKEMSIHDFKPWAGAVDTYERLERNNKLNDLEWSLFEIFGKDDIEETELNDLLWFEPDTVYEMVGLKTESDIEEEIEETESEIGYITEYIDTLEEDIQEYELGSEEWQDAMSNLAGYKLDLEDLYDRLEELRKEFKDL